MVYKVTPDVICDHVRFGLVFWQNLYYQNEKFFVVCEKKKNLKPDLAKNQYWWILKPETSLTKKKIDHWLITSSVCIDW